MSTDSALTAPTRFVEADGIRFAYRRWGKPGGLPLVFMQYFSGNLDDWDPQVTDGFAADYDVILFDNAGVGSSGGETPGTVSEMTRHAVAFCDALGLKEFNAVGFSLGGMIAQQTGARLPRPRQPDRSAGDGPAGRRGHDVHGTLRRGAVRPGTILARRVLLAHRRESGGRAGVPEATWRRGRATGTGPSRRRRPRRNCTQFGNGGRCRRVTGTPRSGTSSTRPSSCTAPRTLWCSRSTPSSSRSTCRMRSSSCIPTQTTALIINMQRSS